MSQKSSRLAEAMCPNLHFRHVILDDIPYIWTGVQLPEEIEGATPSAATYLYRSTLPAVGSAAARKYCQLTGLTSR